MPGGSLIEKWVISCSPSLRVRWMLNGEKRPAALLIEPASRPGWKGGVPPAGQGPELGPEMIVNAEVVVIGLVPYRGVRTAVAAYSPQSGGLANGDRVPSRKCRVKWLNGS